MSTLNDTLKLIKDDEKLMSIVNQSANLGKDAYKHITTKDVLSHFESNGWYMSKGSYKKSRKIENDGFQKHILRLRNDDYKIGDNFVEAIVSNSHDGKSAFTLSMGIYRLVCSNGLVVGDQFWSAKIRHTGLTYEKLQSSLVEFTMKIDELKLTIANMENKQLSQLEMIALAKRLGEVKMLVGTIFNPSDLLVSERSEDTSNDLFTVFNRIQEKLVNGGVSFQKEKTLDDGKVVSMRSKTRQIRGAQKDFDLNNRLFNETLDFMKIAA